MEDSFLHLQQRTRQRFASAAREKEPAAALTTELTHLWNEADTLLGARPAGEQRHIACGPGCGYCCVVNVPVTLPEALGIVRYLEAASGIDAVSLRSGLDDLWREVGGLDDNDRLLMRRPCAFLDKEGCCLIHSVRPLICRSITSTDPARCREAIFNETFGRTSLILMYRFQQQLYDSLFIGMAEGLSDAGLDGRSCQLTGLVRYLLADAQAGVRLSQGEPYRWSDLYP